MDTPSHHPLARIKELARIVLYHKILAVPTANLHGTEVFIYVCYCATALIGMLAKVSFDMNDMECYHSACDLYSLKEFNVFSYFKRFSV